MTCCLNKNIYSRSKNWISLIKSVEIRQKRAVRPYYANLYAYAANNPVNYTDPDGRFSKSQELSKTEKTLSWSDFANLRDDKKKTQDIRDKIHSFISWGLTFLGLAGGEVVKDIAGGISTMEGLLGVKPDNLANLNDALQEISNKVADISEATGKAATVEIVEVTTRTATNEDTTAIGGAALVNTMMQHTITETTTLEITINGEKQKPIVVSEKQTCTYYERSVNYDDFNWAQ